MFVSNPQGFLALPEEKLDSALRDVIEEALQGFGIGSFTAAIASVESKSCQSVLEKVRRSDFMIADITGMNPFVMLDVGMALGLGKPILLLSEGRVGEDLPIDLRAHQIAVYKSNDLDRVRQYLELMIKDSLAQRQAVQSQ